MTRVYAHSKITAASAATPASSKVVLGRLARSHAKPVWHVAAAAKNAPYRYDSLMCSGSTTRCTAAAASEPITASASSSIGIRVSALGVRRARRGAQRCGIDRVGGHVAIEMRTGTGTGVASHRESSSPPKSTGSSGSPRRPRM
jgi:hypothetical protein